ncbi:aminoglycoside 6'-N-acetyltransferase [Lentibacillus halodurans]|uniref:Aminoglycoside 6'-N-acetyltransferase n=1 Tax=Lentibacillus halodurans TaxID=237679 RepID=A0A1I0ZW14_9BACI|nr:GNAT family N-acetyltransferase [Lentibacillus halodurans]SFB28478.1 aminoglycoside 6'-N-acetyltransferase [Lentibacillus halodurans]
MILRQDHLKVRHFEKNDSHLLAKWLSDPSVLEFYEGRDNPFDLQKVNQNFYGRNDKVIRCIAVFCGVDIGYIQFYMLDEETRGIYGYDGTEVIYGMDQFIGETEYRNRGFGTLLVCSMASYLIEQEQAERVVMDPQVRNERAIRCYLKCDLKKVRLLPEHELHEGQYRDCWLMEYVK